MVSNRVRISVDMDWELVKWLDAYGKQKRKSRNALIREAVARLQAAEKEETNE